MTLDQFTDWVCISLGDFGPDTKNRVKFMVPQSVRRVMYADQWESMTRWDTISVTSGDYTDLPEDIFKIWRLYRSGYTKPLNYITPDQYIDRKSVGDDFYGKQVVAYTVIGSGNLGKKRIYWMDPATTGYTVYGIFSIKIDVSAIQVIPEHFYDAIKAHLITEITPKWFVRPGGERVPNPAFQPLWSAFMQAMAVLRTIETGHMDRDVHSELDDVGKNATQYYHP